MLAVGAAASALASAAASGAPASASTSTALVAWTQLTPSASPPGRANATLAFDGAVGQFVLFGGTGSSSALDDTWTWNGSTWAQVDDAGDAGCTSSCTQSPPARSAQSMAYDPATGQLVLFGGTTGGATPSVLDDTWAWNGSTWSQLDDSGDPGCTTSCTTSPPPRYGASFDFDPETGGLVLFGGTSTSGSALEDTWEWSGTSWTQVDDTGDAGCTTSCTQSPPARSGGSFALDPADGEDVLFGGLGASASALNDTWTWSGSTAVWAQVDDTGDAGCTTSCTQSPPARSGASLVYDDSIGELLLFGGTDRAGARSTTAGG